MEQNPSEIIRSILPIAISGIFITSLVAIIFIIYYYMYRTKKALYESIVQSIATGNTIPETIANRFGEKVKTNHDAAHYLLIMTSLMSIVLIIVGLGNALSERGEAIPFWIATLLGCAGLVATIRILIRRSANQPTCKKEHTEDNKSDNCGC